MVMESGPGGFRDRISGETLALLEEAASQFADDDTLFAAIAAWDERLTAAARRLIGSFAESDARGPMFDYELMAVVPLAEESVIGVIKSEQRRRAVLALPSAAFMIDGAGVVVVANEPAIRQLGIIPAKVLPVDLIDPVFVQAYRDLVASLGNAETESRSRIIRIGAEENGQSLFEARLRPEGEPGVILFRRIGIGLTDAGARFLADAFDLTESEVGIIRLMMDGQNTREIAASRNTAETTVRSQLKSIFQKTGTSGQTELMRIVSGISLFQATGANATPRLPHQLRAQPDSAARLIRTPRGEFVQVEETGAPDGRPFLTLHGLFLGYAYPEQAEILLAQKGLRRVGLMRPGFGSSTPADPGSDLGEIVDRFASVMGSLGIDKCPVVAHGFGGAHAFAFAHRHPDRVSAIINIGAYLPAQSMASVMRLSGFQRALMFAARHSPALFAFFSRTAERVLERDGMVEFLRRYLGTSNADIAMLAKFQSEASFRFRINLAQAQDVETYRQECLLQMSDLSAYSRHPAMPVVIIHGVQDPVFPIDLIRKAAGRLKADDFLELADCGQMILYSRPDIAVAAIDRFA